MSNKITEIKGMDADSAAKLAAANINSTQDLIDHASTTKQRNDLAKQTGLDAKVLTEWLNRADLMRLKGVGPEMSNLLEECGVDSCKELQHRKAENLQAKLKETNDAKKITHHAPTLGQVEEWIKEAAAFAAAKPAE